MKACVSFITLLVALLLCLPSCAFGGYDMSDLVTSDLLNPFDQPDFTKEEIPENRPEAVLIEYAGTVKEVINLVKGDYAAELSGGTLDDYDGDGYPELVLLYLTNENEFVAKIAYHSADKQVTYATFLLGQDAGGAAPGVRVTGKDNEVFFHLIYKNTTRAIVQYGKDAVYRYKDGELIPAHYLSWLENMETGATICCVDNQENEKAFLDLYGAKSAKGLSSFREGAVPLMNLKELQDAILQVYQVMARQPK